MRRIYRLVTFIKMSRFCFDDSDPLSFVCQVVDDRKQWWKVRNGFGATGYVPSNILEITKALDLNSRGEPIYSHTIQVAKTDHGLSPDSPFLCRLTFIRVLFLIIKAHDAKEGV